MIPASSHTSYYQPSILHCGPRHGRVLCAVWIPGRTVNKHDKMVIILHCTFGVVLYSNNKNRNRSQTFKSKFFLSGDESWVSNSQLEWAGGRLRQDSRLRASSASVHRQSICSTCLSVQVPGGGAQPEPQPSWQLLLVSSSQDWALLSPSSTWFLHILDCLQLSYCPGPCSSPERHNI